MKEMDSVALELYKKQRTLLEKSFINQLNHSLEETLNEWNEMPLIKQTIYRHQYDTYINDLTKRIKTEIAKLRLLKKTEPEEILKDDIANIITSKQAIPESKNPFEWVTKFRNNFLNLDCFAREMLFGRIDSKELWGYDIISTIIDAETVDLEDKPAIEQATIMQDLVSKIINDNKSSNNKNYIEEPSDAFLDTLSGQITMNI